MKKSLLFIAAMLLAGATMAQQMVSTSVEKRNVIIEEYTGVGCGYCPDGHARANEICENNAGHAWAINIHQGGYATGSGYETQWGDGLAGQYSISGYPCGTVNRGSMSDRGQWAGQAASIRNQDSPVNVAARATIDPMTREMVIDVEVYYTGTQTVTSNFLNVVLVQNNIIGQQSNYGNYNAEYITEDGQYRHMHMLRDLITGQWGEELTDLDTNTLLERTYTYQIPAAIGAVPINNFDDLEVIVFVSETHKNILTGTEAEKVIGPGFYISSYDNGAVDCGLTFTPTVTVTNTFDMDVTAFTLTYNNETIEYNTTVASGNSYVAELPTITIEAPESYAQISESGIVTINTYTMDGEEITVSAPNIEFEIANFDFYTAAGHFLLDFAIDRYGGEDHAFWIDQSNCSTLWHTPNFSNSGSNSSPARHFFYTIDPAEAGIYILRITDDYGDGMLYASQSNPAGFTLYSVDEAGNRTAVIEHDGDFTTKLEYYINVTNSGNGQYVGIDDVPSVNFDIYPNPVNDLLYVNCSENISRLEVLDMAGRTVVSMNGNVNSINTQALSAGVYMLRVVTENGVSSQKFVKE